MKELQKVLIDPARVSSSDDPQIDIRLGNTSASGIKPVEDLSDFGEVDLIVYLDFGQYGFLEVRHFS